MENTYTFELAGRPLEITIGKLAEQANGECLIKYGDSVVLTTATGASKVSEGIDFFPLTVEYQEKFYASGRIPGGFIKREGRPSDNAVLTSRLIDRPIRPLFPDGYRNEVQVIATVLSSDPDNMPELVAMLGSSIALSISDIPFFGPTGSVLVGYIDGEYIINPSEDQRKQSELYLIVSGTKDAIMMVEAEASILPEEIILEAILFGHKEIVKFCEFVETIVDEIGKEKIQVELEKIDPQIEEDVRDFGFDLINKAMKSPEKTQRGKLKDQAESEIYDHLEDKYPEGKKDIGKVIDKISEEIFRDQIVNDEERIDGRDFDEIRPIKTEIDLLPRTHGSALFTRGQTQVMSILTLGSSSDVQIVDSPDGESEKSYTHHYNFPPFSVGDTRPVRGPGRREIGHGYLAEKALVPVLPDTEDFPYTIRVVSEVLSSNGSSSMASVCGSSMSLMAGGVPIKSPVAGIAMGLIKEGDFVRVLTDIQGLEDFLGDMDFKVAGTKDGVTALQMDIKIDGVDKEVLSEALNKAKKGRLFILGKMAESISSPREELSDNAPIITSMQINPEKIGDVIGSGGKTINEIIDETGVEINIEDDGRVFITGDNRENAKRAMDIIESIVKDIEVGQVYEGTVKRITNFGAFVEIARGKEGLLHISKIAHKHVDKVEDVLSLGEKVKVKVIKIDKQGKIDLSRKDLIEKQEQE